MVNLSQGEVQEAYELDSSPHMNVTSVHDRPASPTEAGPEDHLLPESPLGPTHCKLKPEKSIGQDLLHEGYDRTEGVRTSCVTYCLVSLIL